MTIPAKKGSTPLSAYAPEFVPVYTDIHCLFLTFSNGFPLTESQIFNFFNRYFAPYVDHVYVHKPRTMGRVTKPSLFGKVMFKHRNIPIFLMGNRDKACFTIDGFPLYCRRFVSGQNTTTTATMSRE